MEETLTEATAVVILMHPKVRMVVTIILFVRRSVYWYLGLFDCSLVSEASMRI